MDHELPVPPHIVREPSSGSLLGRQDILKRDRDIDDAHE
jgi:hypothetical protein